MNTINIDRDNLIIDVNKPNRIRSSNIIVDRNKKKTNIDSNLFDRKQTEKKKTNIDSNLFQKKQSDRKQSERKQSERKQSDRKQSERKQSERKQSERKLSDRKQSERKLSYRKQSDRKLSERKQLIKTKTNFYESIIQYKKYFYENKISREPFNYIEQHNVFQNAMMILNDKYKFDKNDVNKIKFISFSRFKTRLLLDRLKEDTSIKFFFSKNKNNLSKLINKFYGNYLLQDDVDSKQLPRFLQKKSKSKSKFGGSFLSKEGNNFLSILATLDKKHDFTKNDVSHSMTTYIMESGNRDIQERIKNIPEYNEMSTLFNSNKNYEENILLNTIEHILGSKDKYFTNAKNFANFAFIDVDNLLQKLIIKHNSQFEVDEEIDANKTNAMQKLIDYIRKFYNYDNPDPLNKYKYLFDTDVKLHSKLREMIDDQKLHHELYDKIGTQLKPFENAYDSHSSNDIIIDDADINLFKEITDKNFNYVLSDANRNNDYNFAIKSIVNEYLGFKIVSSNIANANKYYPCVILKKYNQKIFEDRKYDDLLNKHYTDLHKQYLDKNSLAKFIKATPYIEYSCKSFSSIGLLKEYINILIEIRKNEQTAFDKLSEFLNDKNINKIENEENSAKVVLHNIVAYLFYCNDHLADPSDQDAVIETIDEVITILFDLKKSGDWGQSLFCSEYNSKNIEQKDCFFVSGDKLAAVRSLLCNNVKTILQVDHKITDDTIMNKKTILALYRNKFSLTFKYFIEQLNKECLSLKAFEGFRDKIKPEFFMSPDLLRNDTIINKENEIITSANFNGNIFELFINFLHKQFYVFLFIYSSVLLKEINTKTINFDYQNIINKQNEANEIMKEIDEDEIDKYLLFDNPNYNKFLLLEIFTKYPAGSLINFQEEYLIEAYNKDVPIKQDDIKINISGMITNYETFHNQKIFDVIKNHIEKIYPEVKNFELFDKDFNKNVKEIKIQKISDLLQQIANIAELHETYTLLLCDDKHINLYDDEYLESIVKNEPNISKTVIKRIMDDNNNQIKIFCDTFTHFLFANKNKFIDVKKIIKEDFILYELPKLIQIQAYYKNLFRELEELKPYLKPNEGSDLIIFFKKDIPGIDLYKDFLESIRVNLNQFWKDYSDQDIRIIQKDDADKELLEEYNAFIKPKPNQSAELSYELGELLYQYYICVAYPRLFIGINNPQNLSDIEKENIIQKLLKLYANTNIKKIYPNKPENSGELNRIDLNYKRLYKTIQRKLESLKKQIHLLKKNLDLYYDGDKINIDRIFQQPKQDKEIANFYKDMVDSPIIMDVDQGSGRIFSDSSSNENSEEKSKFNGGSSSGSQKKAKFEDAIEMDHDAYNTPANKKMKLPAPTEVRRSNRKRDNPDDVELNDDQKEKLIIELYNKLQTNQFKYNPEHFEAILNKTNYLSFLKKEHKLPQNRTDKTKDLEEILGDIGFIINIVNYFTKMINSRTSNIFRNINDIFKNDNLEIIKFITSKKIEYYYEIYNLMPLIYKYLKFVVYNKSEFILSSKTSFKKIFISKYKNKIDKILYNLEVIFNIFIDKPKSLSTPGRGRGTGRGGPGRGRGTGRGFGIGRGFGGPQPSPQIPMNSPSGTGRGRGVAIGSPPPSLLFPMNSPSGTGRGRGFGINGSPPPLQPQLQAQSPPQAQAPPPLQPQLQAQSPPQAQAPPQALPQAPPSTKRGRGRPPGSKSKKP